MKENGTGFCPVPFCCIFCMIEALTYRKRAVSISCDFDVVLSISTGFERDGLATLRGAAKRRH